MQLKVWYILILVTVISYPAFSQQSGQKTSNTNIEYLTVETFKQKVFDYTKSKTWIYKGKKPCIIDFYADWCRPCKMIAPILEELGNDYKGKIYVYKINVDQQKELATTFGIQSIPAVLFVPLKGQPQMMVGAHNKEEYQKNVNDFLSVKK